MINLTDDKDQIINKIKKAKTDTLPLPSASADLEKRPEAKNLMGIYSSLMDVSQAMVDKISPISSEIKKLLSDKKYLNKILLEGSKKADNFFINKFNFYNY